MSRDPRELARLTAEQRSSAPYSDRWKYALEMAAKVYTGTGNATGFRKLAKQIYALQLEAD